MITLALSLSLCVCVCESECVMGSPYSPNLYSTSLKMYDYAISKKTFMEQINLNKFLKSHSKGSVQTQMFKNLPRRSYQNNQPVHLYSHSS